MKAYLKIIIMSLTLILIIVGIVLVLIKDVDFKIFETISTKTVTLKKDSVEGLMVAEEETKEKYNKQLNALANAQDAYKASKQKYDAIDQATIEMVQEATAEEKYFIEYLWIVLGNYARSNDLMIDIVTPSSVKAKQENVKTEESGKDNSNNEENKTDTSKKENTLDVSIEKDAIKIVVTGRYANVADFVYEVENDKELKFRLDNIKMTYTKNNAIQATFNVLNLKVKK